MYSGKGESSWTENERLTELGYGNGDGEGSYHSHIVSSLDYGMGSVAGEPFGWSKGWGEDDAPWTD